MLFAYLVGLVLIIAGLLTTLSQIDKADDARIRRQMVSRVVWILVALMLQINLLIWVIRP